MPTAVREKPIRIQRRRIAGWRMPPNTVYVGRPTIFGNPWTVAWSREQGLVAEGHHESAVLSNFRAWLTWTDEHRLRYAGTELTKYEERRAELLKRIGELRGKNLSCFCSLDKPCHADILLELANR